MLAHELRNPLASIGNAAYILGSRDAQAHLSWVKDVISRQVKLG
jgi:nitrogen-specific signal transduction histidine kinase